MPHRNNGARNRSILVGTKAGGRESMGVSAAAIDRVCAVGIFSAPRRSTARLAEVALLLRDTLRRRGRRERRGCVLYSAHDPAVIVGHPLRIVGELSEASFEPPTNSRASLASFAIPDNLAYSLALAR